MPSLKQLLHGALGVIAAAALSACQSQRDFSSPEDAVAALTTAAERDDKSELRRIFGPDGAELRSDDPEQDRLDVAAFRRALAEAAEIERRGDDSATLLVGEERWPFAVPIVREADRWRFDTEAGIEELDNRRIGRNELRTIAALRTLVDAQAAYFSSDRDGDAVPEYAARLLSSPGTRDGLYWPSPGGVDPSPIGPVLASAATRHDDEGDRIPYNGYRFRLLTRQGEAAPGGAMDFSSPDGLTGGWAAIAWPAEYDVSGVMTFLVSSAGVIYQADLGPDTESATAAITEFAPGEGWSPVGR